MGKPTYIVLKHPSVFSSVHFSNVISSSFFLYQPSIQSLFKSFWLPNLPSTVKVKVLVTQSCLTLSDPMDCGPPGSSVHGILQARILEWVATSLFPSQGIFLTKGLKPGLPHCRQTLYQINHQGSQNTGLYLWICL